jgi:DNA-binding NarL/FixJ family response regulator
MGTRVVLADSEILVRAAICALIDRAGAYEVVAEATDGLEALACIESYGPDLVVLETYLPRVAGPEVVRQAKHRGSQALFLFLSSRAGQRQVEEALRAGANGYVSKSDSADALLSAIEAVTGGQTYFSASATNHLVDIALGRNHPASDRANLSSREREVLLLIAEGLSTKEIAASLSLSVRTIDSHRATVMDKLGIHKVSGLVRYAIREGLLNP